MICKYTNIHDLIKIELIYIFYNNYYFKYLKLKKYIYLISKYIYQKKINIIEYILTNGTLLLINHKYHIIYIFNNIYFIIFD